MSRSAPGRQPILAAIAGVLVISLCVTPAWAAAAGAKELPDSAQELDAARVRLLPGSPFYDRQELHRRGYLAAFDCDKLLFHYRAQAGLPQPESVRRGYSGWDSGFIRGHMAGHYLSAASRMAAATGDASFSEKVDYMVAELAKCQDALNQDGYLAAFPSGAFDRLEGKRANGGGVVVPYYTIHKIMAGLLDAHHYLGNAQALQVATKMADYFEKRLASLNAEQIERIFRTDGSRNPQNEFGAMSDVLAELYAVTGDRRHLDAAQLFNRPWFIDPLVEGEDRLAGLHGNTHVAQAVGLAHCANLTGDANEVRASENFWKIVIREHSFVIGGDTFHEWFDKPRVETGPCIDGQKELPPTTAESCNTHNMLKLTAYLFEQNQNAEYADYFERALYNHLLATVAPDTGAMTYFMPLRGNFRTYLNGTFCCVGSGIENTPRYNEGIYFQQGHSLWVNLYIPSELDWREAGMVLRQEGDITRGEPVRFTVVKAPGEESIRLNLRIPHWISRPAAVSVNGKVEEDAGRPSTYVSLERKWKAGDVVALTLPASLRLEKAKDDPSMVSVFFGPVLLAGELGRANMPNSDCADKDAYLKIPSVAVPEIVSSSMNPTDWLRPIESEPLAFRVQDAGSADGIVFRPLYGVHHQRYAVYWRVREDSMPRRVPEATTPRPTDGDPVDDGENPPAISASSDFDRRFLRAQAAEAVGGASKVTDATASGGQLVRLAKSGQGVRFTGLPAASKLAIRYASVELGTITVAVNDEPARKVNVHSSGALTGSFLHAIIDVAIPVNAVLTVSLSADDVALNVEGILVGNRDLGLPPDIWNLPPLPVAAGPYAADWKAISRIYTVPQWWRDAKFGAWAHWDPQSMPEQGDWYARGMYMQGSRQYNYHLEHFGHPSEYGYKDICHNWVIDRWDPKALMDLYVEMGARYFMAMGVHHDNFDCWDSTYQPWNSVRVGPKQDIVGTWEKIARQHGLRFGIGFHHSPGRTWGQFMPVRYTSDRSGPKQGVPYDALQTILDGKGQWWEGLDPVDLYGPPHTMARGPRSRPGNDPLLSPFANQFMWRVDDAVTKYHPDVIYFDEHAGDSQVDLGVHMGLGFLGPQLAANYYNKSLEWNHGNMEAVLNLKGVGGRYNSFQNSPELLPCVDHSLVKSTEAVIEPEIMAYSFQTETTIADWHYRTGQRYMDAKRLIGLLMENVCRNGTMLLNITQHGRGDLDPEVVRICEDIGAWLKVNGEAVYGSRPFDVYGEDAVRYTRNHGKVYATLLDWQGGPVTLKALHTGGATLGKVSKVELLGSDVTLTFVQDDQGLTVTPGGSAEPLSGIADEQLASGCRVLRITHDKGWFNDDDPGATYPGWVRRCNLGTGDFNNDLTTSDTPGDVWNCSFTGSNVSVIAPKEPAAGKIEIRIDGQTRATVDLSVTGARQAQQTVCELTGLAPGQHAVSIVNRGPGPVAVDALVVR